MGKHSGHHRIGDHASQTAHRLRWLRYRSDQDTYHFGFCRIDRRRWFRRPEKLERLKALKGLGHFSAKVV